MNVPSEKTYGDARLAAVVAELRADMAKNTTKIIAWLVVLWCAGIVLIISSLIIFTRGTVNGVMPASTAAPAPAPPIIIQLPQVWLQGAPATAPPPKP